MSQSETPNIIWVNNWRFLNGKPLLRVMQILNPPTLDRPDMKVAFEIGRAAHTQIERKFEEDAVMEIAYHIDRGNYIIEFHPDMFFPRQNLVVEIKSAKYFLIERYMCIKQLSAYVAALKPQDAQHGIFALYELEFQNGSPRVKSMSFQAEPLIPAEEIMAEIFEKGDVMYAKLHAEGKF